MQHKNGVWHCNVVGVVVQQVSLFRGSTKAAPSSEMEAHQWREREREGGRERGRVMVFLPEGRHCRATSEQVPSFKRVLVQKFSRERRQDHPNSHSCDTLALAEKNSPKCPRPPVRSRSACNLLSRLQTETNLHAAIHCPDTSREMAKVWFTEPPNLGRDSMARNS